MAQKRYFLAKVPDTPEQIQVKIDRLNRECTLLLDSIIRNQNDLLNNHLKYGDQKIAYIKDIILKSQAKKHKNSLKISRLQKKLK